jgi:hypothetical protein
MLIFVKHRLRFTRSISHRELGTGSELSIQMSLRIETRHRPRRRRPRRRPRRCRAANGNHYRSRVIDLQT